MAFRFVKSRSVYCVVETRANGESYTGVCCLDKFDAHDVTWASMYGKFELVTAKNLICVSLENGEDLLFRLDDL